MAVKVRVPTPLMKLTDNKSEVTADGSNITEILNNLESQFAGIKERICEDDGTPRTEAVTKDDREHSQWYDRNTMWMQSRSSLLKNS